MPRGLAFFVLTAFADLLTPRPRPDHRRPREHPRRGGAADPAALVAGAESLPEHPRRRASRTGTTPRGRAMYITTRFADTPQVHHVARPGGGAQAAHVPARAGPERLGPARSTTSSSIGHGRGRCRELPALPPGSNRRRAAADHRRQEPQHRPALVALGRAPGLEQQRPQRPRHGPLPRRRPPIPTSSGGSRKSRASGRSPTGRPTSRGSSPWSTSRSTNRMSMSSRSRPARPTTITPRRADPKAEPVAASDARWSKDGKSIYYITDKGSEFRRLARHDLVTGADEVADRRRSPGTSRSTT